MRKILFSSFIVLLTLRALTAESGLSFSTVFKGRDQFDRLVNQARQGDWQSLPIGGVTDVQRITVTSSGVTDVFSQVLPNAAVSMNVLLGDTTGNKAVSASDIAQTKGRSGMAVSEANFRSDVTVDGAINATDISLVKARSGMQVGALAENQK